MFGSHQPVLFRSFARRCFMPLHDSVRTRPATFDASSVLVSRLCSLVATTLGCGAAVGFAGARSWIILAFGVPLEEVDSPLTCEPASPDSRGKVLAWLSGVSTPQSSSKAEFSSRTFHVFDPELGTFFAVIGAHGVHTQDIVSCGAR